MKLKNKTMITSNKRYQNQVSALTMWVNPLLAIRHVPPDLMRALEWFMRFPSQIYKGIDNHAPALWMVNAHLFPRTR